MRICVYVWVRCVLGVRVQHVCMWNLCVCFHIWVDEDLSELMQQ
jgi:hypothetical protein